MLTDEEAAALGKRLRDQAVAGDSIRPGPGNPGGYSQEAWTDRARANVLKQTSLIVDPPDGRIPAMTPEAQTATAAHRAAGGHPVRQRPTGSATMIRRIAACRNGACSDSAPGRHSSPAATTTTSRSCRRQAMWCCFSR